MMIVNRKYVSLKQNRFLPFSRQASVEKQINKQTKNKKKELHVYFHIKK